MHNLLLPCIGIGLLRPEQPSDRRRIVLHAKKIQIPENPTDFLGRTKGALAQHKSTSQCILAKKESPEVPISAEIQNSAVALRKGTQGGAER